MGLVDSDLLTVGVDDEDHVRGLLHVADTVEVGLQLSEFLLQKDLFLLGQKLHTAVSFHSLELFHALNARADGGEVGEHTTEPTSVYVRHTAAVSSFSNRFLSLLLGAYEQNRAALFSATGNCGVSSVETVHGLLEVDDVDVATVAASSWGSSDGSDDRSGCLRRAGSVQ